jgi:GNAT superfamily N-acetyltransferase
VKASDLLGRHAYDADGRDLGVIADLLARPSGRDGARIYAVLVTPGHRGRLLGYERPGIQGPWLLERFADWLHRGTREIPWAQLRLSPTETAPPTL